MQFRIIPDSIRAVDNGRPDLFIVYDVFTSPDHSFSGLPR